MEERDQSDLNLFLLLVLGRLANFTHKPCAIFVFLFLSFFFFFCWTAWPT